MRKRKIYVGFLEPEKMERSNIYVSLTKRQTWKSKYAAEFGNYEMEVYIKSRKPFKVPFGKNEGKETKEYDHLVHASNTTDIHINREMQEWIDNLLKENNGEVIYNFKEEGFLLKEKLRATEGTLRNLEKVISDLRENQLKDVHFNEKLGDIRISH